MPKCIIADDSKIIRSIIRKIMYNHGFEVLETDNGEAVWDLYLKMQGDVPLIIMDCKLPVLDGIGVLYKIRKHEQGKKLRSVIILSSSITNEANIRDAFECGADDYLMKPFDEDILNSKLEILGIV